ncbi:MAG: tRNA epoxyqueuosine(34) reductase QueG [Firmicutes bacterium]|nr:tRNA epoxyqueuosine(34) reductase QueG [Bacillota bacterium]
MHAIKQELLQYAADLGFDLVGITTPDPLEEAWVEINRRIKAGIYSSLAPGSPEERTTPALLLSGVQSVVMVAMSYSVDPRLHPMAHDETNLTQQLDQCTPGPASVYRGLLSRYARGQDYHQVMVPRLHDLADFLEHLVPGTRSRVIVDSGPLAEKAMAYRAGLGFFGWNSCLITERFGSWVFLGSLLTTAPLPPDPFQPKLCQQCGLCMKACPTGAIIAPYVVDPHLCLSQVTQARGIMPEEFREPLGNRLFGCDTCQAVCPHNAAPEWGNHPEFIPHPLLGNAPPLEMVINLTNRTFQATFAQTAAGWRGKKVLQRNALINLGNIGNVNSISLITAALKDQTAPIRAAAHWALSAVRMRSAQRR